MTTIKPHLVRAGKNYSIPTFLRRNRNLIYLSQTPLTCRTNILPQRKTTRVNLNTLLPTVTVLRPLIKLKL